MRQDARRWGVETEARGKSTGRRDGDRWEEWDCEWGVRGVVAGGGGGKGGGGGRGGGGGESETDRTTDLREKRLAPFFPPLKTDICHALEK